MVIQAVLASVVRLALAAATAAVGDEIPNWSAPETWTPARSVSTQAARAATEPLPFVAVTPCRGADTRGNGFTGQYGPPSLGGNSTRTFTIAGTCGVPASAAAVSLNFTVTNNPSFGDIRVFPAGGSVLVSTLNWGPGTGSVANAAVVQLSAGGAISVQVDGPGPLDLIYDINGYYAAPPATGLVEGRRAIMDQFWTPQNAVNLGLTTMVDIPALVKFDGSDLWVSTNSTVSRVRASDGKLLETWTGAAGAAGVLVAMGRVFVAGGGSPASSTASIRPRRREPSLRSRAASGILPLESPSTVRGSGRRTGRETPRDPSRSCRRARRFPSTS